MKTYAKKGNKKQQNDVKVVPFVVPLGIQK